MAKEKTYKLNPDEIKQLAYLITEKSFQCENFDDVAAKVLTTYLKSIEFLEEKTKEPNVYETKNSFRL